MKKKKNIVIFGSLGLLLFSLSLTIPSAYAKTRSIEKMVPKVKKELAPELETNGIIYGKNKWIIT